MYYQQSKDRSIAWCGVAQVLSASRVPVPVSARLQQYDVHVKAEREGEEALGWRVDPNLWGLFRLLTMEMDRFEDSGSRRDTLLASRWRVRLLR
jgi:hypothetical protein